MADKGVMIYYRAGVEDFDYDTGFVKATDYEALRKRCEAVEAALRDLLALPFAIHQLQGLHQGIGTATRDAAWLNAEKAIAAAQEPSHG